MDDFTPITLTDLAETKGGFSVLVYILNRCLEDRDYSALAAFHRYIGEILAAFESKRSPSNPSNS